MSSNHITSGIGSKYRKSRKKGFVDKADMVKCSRSCIESRDSTCTHVNDLPDDFLLNIFQCLDCCGDCESFGLTCHRWLRIQNRSRQSLRVPCSLARVESYSLIRSILTCSVIRNLLSRFQWLQSLTLSYCHELPDSALFYVQCHGSQLRSLCLNYCFKITDVGLGHVANGCPLLESISLIQCNITDVGLETLAKSCVGLKDIDLSLCQHITDHGVGVITQKCRQLSVVRVSCCSSVGGIGFQGSPPTLILVEVSSCKIEPEGMMAIVGGGGLEFLNVSGLICCSGGDSLMAIGGGFATRLRVLYCMECKSINDDTVALIAKGCPLLEEWNLAECHRINISGWESIASNCLNLAKLNVSRCLNFCGHALFALMDGCKRLMVLFMHSCPQVSDSAIESFRRYRSDVMVEE